MKKLITLIALVAVGTAANAQRQADISVTLLNPTSGATITAGQSFNINAVVTNLGTDTVRATDTLLYANEIDNNLITSNGTPIIYYLTGRTLATNDTVQINTSLQLSFSSQLNGAHTFCLVAQPINRTPTDSLSDATLTNNAGCANVTMGGGTGVAELHASTGAEAAVTVYPNPVQSDINLTINLNKTAEVSVKVLDVTGRTVLSQNAVRMNAGSNAMKLNTNGLANGMYLYQVSTGDNVSSGKFSIMK